MKLVIRSAYVWLGLLVLAFVNGAFRELFLRNVLLIDVLRANQISCLSGVILWTSFVFAIWKRIGITRINETLGVGLAWLIGTAVFETFVLNRNLTWDEILQTYDVSAGQYWGLVLLWIGFLPAAVFRIRLAIHE